MFDTPDRLLLGLVTGFCFGFLLHKGRVADFGVIVGQFLLRDFTMLKVMLTAIVVGGVGVHVIVALGWAGLHIKPLLMGGVVVGAAIFGVGLALLGYCPGTSVAAMAAGSRHAAVGVLGMLTAAAVYAEIYPWVNRSLLAVGDFGAMRLPELIKLPEAVIFGILIVVSGVLFWVLERRAPARGGQVQEASAGRQRG